MVANNVTTLSRRNALKTGLAGIAMLGTGLWGAASALADEENPASSQVAGQDLGALSDDELLALEAAVRAEKIHRQLNAAIVPRGQYVAGVDFAAGTYTVMATEDGDDGGRVVCVYDTQAKENQLSWDLIEVGETTKVTLAEGNVLKLNDGSFALSPFIIDFGMTTGDTAQNSAVPADTAATDTSADSVTPEFKEMMDGYETFMNSYCDFVAKYTSAADSGDAASLASMAADYASLLQQELDWASKIDAVDQTALSPADAAYYVAVQGRVSQRLIETGTSLG